jgi:hypothetical protein
MTESAVLRRSFPTFRSIAEPFRWVGKSRKRIWCAIVVLLAILASGPLWWATQLWGLPDIGDPFDLAAFRSSKIPDDRNAFTLYAQAAARLKLSPKYLARSKAKIDVRGGWASAHPDVRRWVADNREALEVYRRGSERPDALDSDAAFAQGRVTTLTALWSLQQLVLLEASRRQEQGDMAGAWDWCRALLRTIHHVGMRGDPYRRHIIQQWHRQLCDRLAAWSADRRTTPALLRQAIREVVACEALGPSESDTIKAGYVHAIELLQSADNPGGQVPAGRFRWLWHPEFQLTPEQIRALWDWWRFLRREPERSRRVIGLVTANRLAYLETPADQRPNPDPTAALELYHFGPQSPANARVLAPQDLDAWFDTAYDGQQLMQFLDASGTRVIEAENHAEILLLLATEAYRRDHRTDPPAPEALVGPYLEKLPPTVENVRNHPVPTDGKEE